MMNIPSIFLSLCLTAIWFSSNHFVESSVSEWIEDILEKYRGYTEKCNKYECIENIELKYEEFIRKLRHTKRTETSHYRFKVIYPQEFEKKCCPAESAKIFLKMIDKMLLHNRNRGARLSFAYLIDMTKEKARLKQSYGLKSYKANRQAQKLAKEYDTSLLSDNEKRQFDLLTKSATSTDMNISKKLSNISSQMSYVYGHAKACLSESRCLGTGEIGMEDFYRSTDDYDDLALAWVAWRNVTGRKLKNLFSQSIKLENVGPRENGYPDAGYYEYYSDMQDKNFPQTVMKLYKEILPLYRQLHAYVRYKLWKSYPNRFDKKGPIPAHILGNVWAQSFNVMSKIKPYSDQPLADVTGILQSMFDEGQLDEYGMFRMAEEFYTSIGMPPMTSTFWKKSVIKQVKGKVMECHGSAFSMFTKQDFRIKMCTKATHTDFRTIHHEMGHIQYYMAYRNQPAIYRSGACSGFHEAVGDTIALSVNTPEHLHKIKLLKKVPTSKKFDINYLLEVSIDTIAFLPFSLVVDNWRWDVYRGVATPENYNRHWWNLRLKYQGIKPPVERTEDDCDALAKYHVATGVPYIRYFVSHILQFQFYESLCDASGNTKPLHRCDFYRKPVGKKFLEMLKLGQSKPWPEALEILTGSREIKTDAILRFFDPLHKWLIEMNKKLGVHVGW